MSPTSLVFGFYGEGAAEYGFLFAIVERTLEELLPDADLHGIPFDNIDTSGLSQVERMARVGKEARGYTFVVFHLDADGPNTETAYSERFEPGYTQILQDKDSNRVNPDFVPVIPVRNTDAWMLVDFDAFRQAVGTHQGAEELGFKQKPHQVESIPDPKTVFEDAVKNARPGRRKTVALDSVYFPLAQRISLDLLAKVPAYQEFLGRLTDTLKELHYMD